LAEQGVLRSEQGRGTFVLGQPAPETLRPTRELLHSRLKEIACQARDSGLEAAEFLASARQVVGETYRQKPLQLFFVECNPYDTEEVAKSIEHILQVRIEPLLVDELLGSPQVYLGTADLFITTPYHIDEVEAVTAVNRVVSVNVTPTTKTLIDLARIPQEARVAVVAANQQTLERFARMVQITARRAPSTTRLITEVDLPAALEGADVIVDSQAIHQLILELAPEKRMLTVHFQLEASSVEFLRSRLGDLFPEHVRPVGSAESLFR